MHPLTETNHASAAARAIKDPENRSIEIGLLCTLLFHILLVLLAPRLPVELLHASFGPPSAASTGHDFNIELAPDLAAPEPKRDPFRFVETNPDAPANEPDKTDNFSNRNQQSAQEVAATGKDAENRPSIQGQDDIRNDTAIVSGTRSEARPVVPVVVTGPESEETAAQLARAGQVPLSGVDKLEGDSPDGVGTNISQSQAASNNAAQLLDGAKGAASPTGALVAIPEQQKRVPQERQRVDPYQGSTARSTVLQNRISGTPNVGPIGIDAKWSEFGDYMQELIDIVDAQWRNLLDKRSVRPPSGTHATITFKITAQGLIQIVSVEETCGTPGTYVSLSAIQDRQPYRRWSQQMVAVLGEEQTVTFAFYFR